jgi:hypothetical protein
MPPLVLFSALAITAALTAVSTVVAVTPAQATDQAFFGTTGDVRAPAAPAGNDKLIGSTAYLPETNATLQPYISAIIATDIVVTITRPGATVGTCTIFAGGTFCSIFAPSLPAGASLVTVRFATAGSSADFTGTIFGVVASAPTIFLEWQDAAGTWINGTGQPPPIMGTTALRCVTVNNSNATLTWTSLSATATLLPSGSISIPIRDTVAGGATAYFDMYSGSIFGIGSGVCSGGGSFPSGASTGNGNGVGVDPVSGTIDIDQTPAPGTTVTITGVGVDMPYPGKSYAVLLDNVAVAGSPVTTDPPDWDFSLDVNVPADLAPGDHMLKVVELDSGRNVAFAAFPFTVPEPPAADSGSTLATTGQALSGNVLAGASTVGALVIAAGAALIISARRGRRA